MYLTITNPVGTKEEAVEEMNQLLNYVNGKIPALVEFGIKVVLAFVVFFIGSKIIKFVRKIVRRSLEKSSVDKGVEQFIDSMLKFLLYFILIFSIGVRFGLDATSFAAVLASGGVAIGLALQGSLSNFAGGILILLLKPFVVGDYIIEDGNKCEGVVTEIQIFYTKLTTADNRMIVIPNGTLANNSLTNVTGQRERRIDLLVGISYESDLKRAKEVAMNVLKQAPLLCEEREKQVFVDSLGDSAVMLGIRGWAKTEEYWKARWSLTEELKLAFDREGIEIPYSHVEVVMKTPDEKK